MTSIICVLGGGTGFIGNAIASALRHLGVQVTIISRMPGRERISWVKHNNNKEFILMFIN